MKAYIVWNANRTEGVVFAGTPDAESDARLTAKGFEAMERALHRGAAVITLGMDFADQHEDAPLILEEVELPDAEGAQ